MKKLATTILGVAFCVSLASVALVPDAHSQGLIRVSQLYGGGGNSGSTYTNDFIELHNIGNCPVDVTGWSVQYASATGSFGGDAFRTNLSGVIQPGKYYLIQQAAGAGGTTPLPTPDATGNIAMGATAGKVALVSNQTNLAGTCPAGPQIVDFVGYGATANCFEGAGPTPAPSNTNAVLRVLNRCQDSNNNNTDFAAGLPAPKNSASAPDTCATPTGPPGACCIDGVCVVTDEDDCTASEGLFLGNCTTCGPTTCATPTLKGSWGRLKTIYK